MNTRQLKVMNLISDQEISSKLQPNWRADGGKANLKTKQEYSQLVTWKNLADLLVIHF